GDPQMPWKVIVSGFGQIGCVVTSAALNSGKVQWHSQGREWEARPTNIKWGDAGAECVVKSTSVFTILRKSRAHLKAQRVIISAPSADALTFVMGMNHEKYSNSLKIVSNATNCLGPQAKSTPSLPPRRPWMAPLKEDGQGAAQKIIPTSPGTVRAEGQDICELNEKLSVMTFCLHPQFVGLTNCLEKAAKHDDVKEVMKQYHRAPSKDILGYTEDQTRNLNVSFSDGIYRAPFQFHLGTGFGAISVKRQPR
ncbi:LOW QUALITY PROTEIN: Glyceraldehyde-3-phosphate dehydrogenase, partial [Galemys pyrenaicus]